jgi:cysteine desulfurase
MAVNNESGVIQPWREIQTLCAQYKVSMHSDATQWIGKMPAGGIGACDFVTLSAHKFGGPKGIGLLKIPSGIDFSSLLGGGQEFGHRSGTENYPSIVGMLSALRVAESYAATAIPGRFECRDALEAALKACIPGVQILCETAPRVWNTTMLLMPRHEGWRWVEKLDSRGYSVGLGAACATRKGVEGSVAVALGASLDAAKRGVRISAGWESPREAWVGLAQALRAVWRELEAEYSGDSIVDIGML